MTKTERELLVLLAKVVVDTCDEGFGPFDDTLTEEQVDKFRAFLKAEQETHTISSSSDPEVLVTMCENELIIVPQNITGRHVHDYIAAGLMINSNCTKILWNSKVWYIREFERHL